MGDELEKRRGRGKSSGRDWEVGKEMQSLGSRGKEEIENKDERTNIGWEQIDLEEIKYAGKKEL